MSRFTGTPVAATQRGRKPAASTAARTPEPPSSEQSGAQTAPVAGQPAVDFAQLSVLDAVQRKAAIDEPGDAYEREADAAADRVLQMKDPAPLRSAPATLQRKCAKCEDEDRAPLQRKAQAGTREPAADAAGTARTTASSGSTMPETLRAFYEPRFGHDFSRVRLHHDSAAASAASNVNARAFTIGHDVVFGAGEFQPQTERGRHLLAHELAHVVQQGAAGITRTGSATTLSRTSPRLARKGNGYKTGEIKGKDGWTFVAYQDQGFARLAFRVLDSTPDRRIGNVGWVANNPGSLDLSTKTVVDPTDEKKIRRVDAPPAARVAVKQGSYEKNTDDIPTYSRFAVFPTLASGQQAILPMLQVMAKNNGSPTVDGLLRVYVRGILKKGEKDPLGDKYVREIRSVMKPLMKALDEQVQPEVSEQEHKANGDSMTEALMGKPFLDIHPATEQARILEQSILKVESTRDLARVGLEYACGRGFRNEADARAAYANAPGKISQIDAIVNSADVKRQLDQVLGCDTGKT